MPKARKMLSDWEAPYIQSLMKLIETQSKVTLAYWAVDYSERVILPLWRKYYPNDLRPQNALNAARLTPDNVVKVNVFLTDMKDFAEMNEVYKTQFEAPYPARTTIGVAALPMGAHIEIELIARKG
jgi:hypothetical protein